MSDQALPTKIFISILTIGTALGHLILGFLPGWSDFTFLFVIDSALYILFLLGFILVQFNKYSEVFRVLLLGTTVINIIGYYLINANELFSMEGFFLKSLEVILIIIILVDFFQKKLIENAN